MMQIFLILVLLVLLGVAGLFTYRQIKIRNLVRARLMFGFADPNEQVEEVDLSSGDYGLRGAERFFYHLREFLNKPQGKILMFSVGAIASSATMAAMGKPFKSILMGGGGGGILLLTVGLLALYAHHKEKMTKVQDELPNALETLAAIMESGMAFESALNHVLKEADPKHPLYFDLAIVSEAMQKGRRRGEAMRLWANRCSLVYIADVASGMVQADQTGAPLGTVLKHHGQAVLRENEAVIQRRAERLPVRMLMPMAGLILPAVILVAAGPSMVRIFQIIDDIISK